MTTIFERREWRDRVRSTALRDRLRDAGCPIWLEEIMAARAVRGGPLTAWVQSQLDAGIMLRSAQAEHIYRGDSLVETALATGIEIEGVLYTLARFEADEPAIAEFYFE